jgi:exonuclease VII small subunit
MTNTARITHAICGIDGETRSIRREVEAFERFHERVRPLPITSPSSEPTIESDISRFVDIYHETVTGTDDFDDAYSESRREHMVNEFGAGLASRLDRTDHLTGELKRGILASAERSVSSRERFIDVLDAERASLLDARETLDEIIDQLERLPACTIRDSGLETVVDAWETLERLTDQCERLAQRRQRFLIERRNRRFEHAGTTELDAYLYEDLDTIHPVLRTIAETVSSIEAKKTSDDRPTVTA